MFSAFVNLSRCACVSQRSLIIAGTTVGLRSRSDANSYKHLLVALRTAIISFCCFLSLYHKVLLPFQNLWKQLSRMSSWKAALDTGFFFLLVPLNNQRV